MIFNRTTIGKDKAKEAVTRYQEMKDRVMNELKNIDKDNVAANVISEGILSPKKTTLNPSIWDQTSEDTPYILKSDIKDYILTKLEDTLAENHFVGIESIDIVGSNTGYYYDDDSDLDIEVYIPSLDLDTIKEYTLLLPQNKETLPGNPAYLNFYFVYEPAVSLFSNRYSIRSDEWVIFNFDELDLKFSNQTIEAGLSWVRKIELDLAELKKDIIDYHFLTKELYNKDLLSDPEYIGSLSDSKKIEVMSDMDVLSADYEMIRDFRTKAYKVNYDYQKYLTGIKDADNPNLTLNNMIYKLLERYGYLDLLKEIMHVSEEIRDNWDSSIPELINILNIRISHYGE